MPPIQIHISRAVKYAVPHYLYGSRIDDPFPPMQQDASRTADIMEDHPGTSLTLWASS